MSKVQVVNFSHPLSEKAKEQILEATGYNEVDEHIFSSQIDFDKSLYLQLISLAMDAKEALEHAETGLDKVLFVPPALSYSAFITGYILGSTEKTLNIVVLKREGTPPVFVLGDTISL